MHLRTKAAEQRLLHRLNDCKSGPLTLLGLSAYYRDYCGHKRLPLLEAAVRVGRFNKDARVWYDYGQALERSVPYWLSPETTTDAVAAYRRATELDPLHAEAWSAIARCLYLPQDHVFEAKEQALRSAIRANPMVGHYWYALGKLLAYGPCRPDEAAALYERGLSLCEREGQIGWQWYELARIYHDKLMRFDDAERAIRVALDLQPEMKEYWDLSVSISQSRNSDGSSGGASLEPLALKD